MEYLSSISDNLKTINTNQIRWINVLEKCDWVRGTLRISSDVLDFVKFPFEAREEIQHYGKGAVGEMNNFYRNTSGVSIMLDTNSSRLIVKVELKRKWSYRKMNLYNSSGFDVYEVLNGEYVHKTCIAPRDGENIFAEQIACKNGPVCIYFPTYNCIEAFYIGIEDAARCEGYLKEETLPVIFYGHSVTQGAAASRSGNAFPNIVQRRLKRQIINLSCSSCCRGLDSMADVIGRLNCYAVVVDYTRNADSAVALRKSHLPFYQKLRCYHPDKKIILMTSCNFNHWREYYEYDEIVRETYQYAVEHGENTYLLDILSLFEEEEYSLVAVDGSHLNDIGMYRVAAALIDLLKR